MHAAAPVVAEHVPQLAYVQAEQVVAKAAPVPVDTGMNPEAHFVHTVVLEHSSQSESESVQAEQVVAKAAPVPVDTGVNPGAHFVHTVALEQSSQSESVQAVQTLALFHEVSGQASIQDYLSTANFLEVHAVQAL